MNLFGPKKKEKETKTDLRSVDGKYCIYHHGVSVMKHACGTLLCRECLWEYEKCPNCEKEIEKGRKKTAPAVLKAQEQGKPESHTIRQRKIRHVTSVQSPAITPSTAPPPARAVPSTPAPKPSEPGDRAASGPAERRPEPARDLPERASNREIVRVQREKAPEPVGKHENEDEQEDTAGEEQADAGETDADVEDGKTRDNEEGVPEIYDDDLGQRRGRARLPAYKKRQHARPVPESGGDEDEDEEDKKKWSVRTVPPLQKKRDFDSL